MYNIVVEYLPNDSIVAVPDGELLSEAKAIIADAQRSDIYASTSTWALIDWIVAQACEAGDPEKITIVYNEQHYAVDQYGRRLNLPDGMPTNPTWKASEKIVQYSVLARRKESAARMDAAMKFSVQIEDMIGLSKTAFHVCKMLHDTVPDITIEESKEVILRIIKNREGQGAAGYEIGNVLRS